MPALQEDPSAKTPAARHSIGRRALIGFTIMSVMTIGAANLLYGSIEPGAEFTNDPDAVRRRELLAGVASWGEASAPGAIGGDDDGVALLLADGGSLAGMKQSAAQKWIEALQQRSNDKRRLVLAAVVGAASNDHQGLAAAKDTVDAALARGADGMFLDCAATLNEARRRGGPAIEALNAGVVELVRRAREMNPTFLIILDNAAELAADPRVNQLADGAARDNLLFGIDALGRANSRTDVIAGLHGLDRFKRSGRPVFVTERLPVEPRELRAGATQTLAQLGFVGRFLVPSSKL